MSIKLSKEKTSEYVFSHIKAIKISVFLVLGILTCMAAYFLLETHTITISQEKINEEILKKLPMTVKKDSLLTTYAKADFSAIDLKLLDNDIVADIKGNLEVHLIKSRFSKIDATIDTGINFKKNTDSIAIYLNPNKISFKELDFKLEDNRDSTKINEFMKNNLPFIEAKIKDHLKTHPVYTYKASDMKKSVVIMSVKEIKIKNGELQVTFQLFSVFLTVLIGLIIVIGIVYVLFVSPSIILEIFGGLLEAIGGAFI